ncbi:protein FAR1-RELATED SEQUENCE 5-like [Olea europaea var. sylvestris]|uniref:protein FAR1-RELATED SEQUENCE 5-like n=1 Tax=Olea europaea var. sylvestris TaxID=158386 RepID=UPI000C1D46EA|nr:protein FAR1-RELATED SEQUENCE 5-like [Olea europaea var. sylvestris]
MEHGTDELVSALDNDSVAENAIRVEEETLGHNGPILPKVGMMFNDEKQLVDFYKRYAYDVGFPVRRRNSKKGDDELLKYVTLTYSREGQRTTNASGSLNPQPISQTNCKARISSSSYSHGMWRINTVHLEHNHRTSSSKSRLYRCNRELSANVKRKLEVNDFAGIPLYKSFNSAIVEAGGYENMTCVERDCRNYIEQVR